MAKTNATTNWSALYQAAVQAAGTTETGSWDRFYNFLMANSILVLAWATIFTKHVDLDSATGYFTAMVTAMVALNVFGFISGVAWAALGYRSRKHLEGYLSSAKTLESHLAAEIPFEAQPIARNAELKGELPFGWAGSFHLLWLTPLLFAALHCVLLFLSFKFQLSIPSHLLGLIVAPLVVGVVVIIGLWRVKTSAAKRKKPSS